MSAPFWQITPPSAAADCLPCCSQASECCFTVPSLLIPSFLGSRGAPFPDLSSAEAALARSATDCLMWSYSSTGNPVTDTSASFVGGTLQMDSEDSQVYFAPGNLETKVMSRVYLTVAGGLSIAYTLGATYVGSPGPSNYTLQLYADDESTVIATASGSGARSGTFTPTIPADGYYRIYADVLVSSDTAGLYTTSINLTCTPDPACVTDCSIHPCSIQAAYDDGAGGIGFVVPEGCPSCPLGCWPECVSDQTGDCEFPPPAGPGTQCCTFDADIPCIEPPGTGHIVTTVQVRLVMNGLTIGANYSATIFYCQYDFGGTLIGTSSTIISFTATATIETTGYVSVPAAGYNTDYWCVCGCEVLLAA